MTVFLVWLVRLLILVLIIRLIVRAVQSATGRARRPPPRMPERAGGALVRDPQCGTYIPASRALVVGSGRGTHYFCSTACRDAWAASHQRGRVRA